MEAQRSSSARPVFPAPKLRCGTDADMELLDDVLAEVSGDQPPMRDLSGALVAIRRSSPTGLHMLNQQRR